MFRLVASLLVLTSLAYSFSVLPQDGRIVGGVPVDIADYPYQVAVLYPNYLCGGSIVSTRHIITAAHCTYNRLYVLFTVRAGSSRFNFGGVIRTASRIDEHPYYDDSTNDYDISIITLLLPLNYYDGAIEAIPIASYEVRAGYMGTVTGWGKTSEGGSTSDVLRMVEVPIIERYECDDLYGGVGRITDNMICAGYVGIGGYDSCQGDSGGPLVVNGQLVGIVSFGNGCGSPDYPGVYASVSEFYYFIQNILSSPF